MKQKSLGDKITHYFTLISTIFFIMFVTALVASLLIKSTPTLKKFGFSFIFNDNWNIKFLELQSVRPNNNNFILSFTVPLDSQQNIENFITITQNNKMIPYTYQMSNLNLTLQTSSAINDQTYQIIIKQGLKDQFQYKLHQDITWSGSLHSEGRRFDQVVITGSDQGVINSIITDENERQFSIMAFIIGTLLSSLLALTIAFPVSLAVALLLVEYTHPKSSLRKFFSILIDLLAGIPSVVFGLWGLFFLVPIVGANLLSAALVLSIMIIPYCASLTKEALSLVPNKLRQAGFGLGASQYKVITQIMIPYAKSGIIAGVLLTLGRALGETLAVTMVIGNRNQIPTGLFSPAQTIASLIANEYGEASGLKQSALIEAGFVLIIITLLFSLLGRYIVRSSNPTKGK